MVKCLPAPQIHRWPRARKTNPDPIFARPGWRKQSRVAHGAISSKSGRRQTGGKCSKGHCLGSQSQQPGGGQWFAKGQKRGKFYPPPRQSNNPPLKLFRPLRVHAWRRVTYGVPHKIPRDKKSYMGWLRIVLPNSRMCAFF